MSVCEVATFCADATSGSARNTTAATVRAIDRPAAFDARLEAYGVFVINMFIGPHSSEEFRVVVPKSTSPEATEDIALVRGRFAAYSSRTRVRFRNGRY